jgi:hypothetical protein
MHKRKSISRGLKISQKDDEESRQNKKKQDAGSPRLTRTDKKFLAIQTAISTLLRRASPLSTAKDISWTTVDLAALWEVSKNHERHVRELLKCSYPRDRAKIENLLTEMQVNLLSQGADHLETLQRILPRIRSAVYQRRVARLNERARS